MILENNEAQQKLAKLQQSKRIPTFALSPQGFLLIKQEHLLDCGEFRLYCNGQYYRRSGFEYESSSPLPERGLYLCVQGNGKFFAPREDGKTEFSSSKKALSQDFSLVLYLRAIHRLVLLVADGAFAPEAYMVTLSDTPENERFCFAAMRKILENRDCNAAAKLTEEVEVCKDEQEA